MTPEQEQAIGVVNKLLATDYNITMATQMDPWVVIIRDTIAAAVLEETTTLREALENEWRIAHNDYCGCSLDGRMKCDHPKPKALATKPKRKAK